MPCKSTRTLIHHSTFSPLAPEEKTPSPWTKASNPSGRTAPQRSAPFESEFSFNLLLTFVCDLAFYPLFVFSSLDLLSEEIFGTEETPEYISFDSSLEAEDATPEQRINHQLRRRVRHLEHDLRDITTRYQAERERRMVLEALAGGKNFHLYFDSMLTSLSLSTIPLPQMFPTGTVT
jgi:hypothetical protein